MICAAKAVAQTFPVVYDFKSSHDTNNAYTGSLENGASLETLGTYGVLNLGSNNGYFNLGTNFGSMIQGLGNTFTISVDVFVPTTSDISANGNFIWCFSRSSNRGYMFLGAKEMRYAITQQSYQGETSVNGGAQLPKGSWVNIMYVQNGNTGTVYLNNGQKAQNINMNLFPNSLSQLQNNYLGRSCYNGDAYLKGARYTDLRIYNTALNNSDRQSLVNKITELNRLETGVETEEDAVNYDMAAVYVPKVVYKAINLPSTGQFNTNITWVSSNTAYLTNDGQVIKQETDQDVPLTLTATFSLGNTTKTKVYNIKVKQKENYSHYLFAFFPSNDNENIYFAVGEDGYNYTTINNDQAVFLAQGHTVMGGLRDPHILRGEDGYFYMVATDMRSALGWASNRGMVLMKSTDLINWTSSTVHFPTKYAGTYLANVTRVWAPETIYDKEAGKYMIYFSILTNDGTVTYDKVFYCYANSDFTDLEGEPVYFYDRGSATIDMDIVYNEADELYHAFYKNEGSGGICKVTATSLTPTAGQPNGSQWSNPSGTLQQTNEAVEGSGVFRIINDDNWILMYDCYGSGHYQFCSSPDLEKFTFVKNTATSGSFTPRHGTVLPITEQEYQALMQAFPCPSLTEETDPDEDGNYNITQERIHEQAEHTSTWTEISGFGTHSDSRSYINGEAKVNGTWLEKWNGWGTVGENLASKTLKYLPLGNYKLRVSAIASWQSDESVTVQGVSIFADDQTADVHTANGVPELYNLLFDIADGDGYTTALGFRTTADSNANWVSFDNMRLYFMGTETEYRTAMRNMHLDYIAQAEALYTDLCDEFIGNLMEAVEAVNPDETDYEKVCVQLDNLTAAIETAKEHIAQTTILKESDIQLPVAKNNAHVRFIRETGFSQNDLWNTICFPFSMTSQQITDVFGQGTVVEYLSGVQGNGENLELEFTETDNIQANVPYIFKPTVFKSAYCINGVNVSPDENPNTSIDGLVSFKGVYIAGQTLNNNSYYILDNKFYRSTGNTKIKAYRAFFETNSSTVKQLSFYDPNTTGIDVITNSTINDNNAIYDLQGRRVRKKASNLPNGIYIINNKKIFINK